MFFDGTSSAPIEFLQHERCCYQFPISDGFEIARQDLVLRGPGEFIGARQSGLPLLRYANLDEAALVDAARAAAEVMLRDTPVAAEAHLQRWLAGREELLKV